jgi:hypothetical protein
LNAFKVLKQLISNFPAQLCITKPIKQLTDNLNTTKKRSKDNELREMMVLNIVLVAECLAVTGKVVGDLTCWVIIMNSGTERDKD